MNTFYIYPDECAAQFYATDYESADVRTASGIDVFIHTDITIMPGDTGVLIPLGIRVVCRNGNSLSQSEYLPFLLMPRSSIYKTGLLMANSIGLIDKDYRGELKAPVYNHTNHSIHIKKGTALFQLVAPDYLPTNVAINSHDYLFNTTKRGDGGFGSSGNTHNSDAPSVSDNVAAVDDTLAAAIVS